MGKCEKGGAAVEMALVAPILLFFLLGLTDLALTFYYKMRVEEAVNAGAQYAMQTGKTVTVANVVSVIQSASTMKTEVTVAAGNSSNSTTFNAAYCHCFPQDWDGSNLTTPPNNRIANTATGECVSANGVTGNCSSGSEMGRYLVIKGTYTYSPIMPMSSWISTPMISETTVVRLN